VCKYRPIFEKICRTAEGGRDEEETRKDEGMEEKTGIWEEKTGEANAERGGA